MLEWLLLIVAAVAAGILNSIAGGGSFLTFPALVFTGVPPIVANATSAVAVFPGYMGAVVGFKRELQTFDRPQLVRFVVASLVGGLVGALLLLITPDRVFSQLVPWLLVFATMLFAFGGKLMTWIKGHRRQVSLPQEAVLVAVSIYGGYFNGGLGIVLLAAFMLFGITELNLANGLKNGISFFISAISVATFVVAGIVEWPQAIVMMVAATLGGYLGALIAKALPPTWVRFFIIGVGVVMSILFFLRG